MLHLRLIILSVRNDVTVDSEALLVTDFVNLKIKSAQSFRCAHRDRMYGVFIDVSAYTCMNIYICTVFLKKAPHYFHFAQPDHMSTNMFIPDPITPNKENQVLPQHGRQVL
jgi:hypothetical protein